MASESNLSLKDLEEANLGKRDVHLSRTMHYSKKALEQIENALEYAQAIDPENKYTVTWRELRRRSKNTGFSMSSDKQHIVSNTCSQGHTSFHCSLQHLHASTGCGKPHAQL